MELLAWAQANLINVHVPRGKPRVTVEKLLPRGKKKRDAKEPTEDDLLAVQQALSRDPAKAAEDRLEAKKARIRASEAEEEDRRFWNSAEGRRLERLLTEEG